MVITKSDKDLKQVLMAGVRAGVKRPYYLIQNEEQQIFVVSPGRNGSEFNKTVGYFTSFPGMQSYQCLYGQGILLMQRNDLDGEAKEFRIVTLNPGKQVLVPAAWGMCLVNTGRSFLVVLRRSALDEKFIDSSPVLEKQGFAYYVVEKKGEISFEQNPNYRLHPQIAME